jgi:putative ABC transport system substrate-binding protein
MASLIGRRKFLATLLGGAAAWPLAARAQQAGRTPRVGYIRAGTPHNDPFREEFVRGMRDLGYVEGRNVAYEFRHYGDDVESIPTRCQMQKLPSVGKFHWRPSCMAA